MRSQEYRAAMAAWLEKYVQINLESSPPGTGATLRQLAQATRRGNEAAFRQLVKLLARILVSLAGRLEPEDPADLVYALYLACQAGASTLTQMQSGIRTIYRNAWRAKKREAEGLSLYRKVQKLQPDAATLLFDEGLPLQRFIDDDVIDEEDRYLLVGKELLGFECSELAADLGITPGTARARLKRAKDAIREAIKKKKKGL